MASISDVVDECLVVSTAFTDISSDSYNEIGAINFEDNDKVYPYFLFDKSGITSVVDKYNKSTQLASQVTYTAQLYFMNTYTELEMATVTLQDKQGVLIDIANKYFAELKTRTQSGSKGFILGNITFNAFDEVHNNRVVQLSYNVEFITYIEDCSTGIFNY